MVPSPSGSADVLPTSYEASGTPPSAAIAAPPPAASVVVAAAAAAARDESMDLLVVVVVVVVVVNEELSSVDNAIIGVKTGRRRTVNPVAAGDVRRSSVMAED